MFAASRDLTQHNGNAVKLLSHVSTFFTLTLPGNLYLVLKGPIDSSQHGIIHFLEVFPIESQKTEKR